MFFGGVSRALHAYRESHKLRVGWNMPDGQEIELQRPGKESNRA